MEFFQTYGTTILMVVGLVVVFYLMYRSNKKQEKETQKEEDFAYSRNNCNFMYSFSCYIIRSVCGLLAQCYENGEGTALDLAKAKELYQQAADNGIVEAKEWLENQAAE